MIRSSKEIIDHLVVEQIIM